MTKLKIVLDWFPNTNHTGILLAQKNGWFKECGLDVEIVGDVHGHMELHGADMVCGPQIAMMQCMEKGMGLTAVATFTQKCDSGIVSLKEAGIKRPKDLEGKRLTHWNEEWFHKSISRLVENDGGDYGKIKLVCLDVGDIVSTLGTVADATWVYANWENEELIEAGKEINYFNLGDVDPVFDFCAPAIAATHEALRDKGEAIKEFFRQVNKGYRFAAENPEKAVLSVREFMPKGCSDEMLIRSQEHLSPLLLDKNGNWGHIDSLRWNRMAEYLLECGIISGRFDGEFTNEYLV